MVWVMSQDKKTLVDVRGFKQDPNNLSLVGFTEQKEQIGLGQYGSDIELNKALSNVVKDMEVPMPAGSRKVIQVK